MEIRNSFAQMMHEFQFRANHAQCIASVRATLLHTDVTLPSTLVRDGIIFHVCTVFKRPRTFQTTLIFVQGQY